MWPKPHIFDLYGLLQVLQAQSAGKSCSLQILQILQSSGAYMFDAQRVLVTPLMSSGLLFFRLWDFLCWASGIPTKEIFEVRA